MSSKQIITDHDLWRKGMGGAPAGLVGQADSFAYAGLDLNLAQFVNSTFNGSSFTATTFRQAVWRSCGFTGCNFTGCDFESIALTDCVFTHCVFSQSQFRQSRLSGCRFSNCQWEGLNFDGSHWTRVAVLGCTGTTVRADGLFGEQVDFTGSNFEQLEFRNARIN